MKLFESRRSWNLGEKWECYFDDTLNRQRKMENLEEIITEPHKIRKALRFRTQTKHNFVVEIVFILHETFVP